MKIFLIGFMGAGKSFIGKRLASKLGLDFLDMDSILEKKQGMSIAEIFEEHGEGYFRNLEAEYLQEMINLEKVVVATGGGVPCFNDNMEWMNHHGVTIFLDVPVEILTKRLMNESAERPLIKGKTAKELEAFIQNELDERMKYYQQAQFDCHAGFPAEEVVKSLSRYFGRFFPD